MITISFQTDFDKLALTLNDFRRKQLPFAAVHALTTLAQAGRAEVQSGMPNTFDRPTAFSVRGISIRSATKAKLESAVLVLPAQAKYLRLQEQGGMRQPKKTALVTPALVRLNQHGNIPHRALAKAKGRKDVFVGRVKGVGGFWQRQKDGSLKLLARFDASAKVTPHPFFFSRVEAVLRRDFDRIMGAALERALRTARP